MTVAKVKRTLSRATGVPPQQIRLCLNELVLEDRLTPADMDLYDGAMLQMYVVDDYEPGLGQDFGEIAPAVDATPYDPEPAQPQPRSGRRGPYYGGGATVLEASHTVGDSVPRYVGPDVPVSVRGDGRSRAMGVGAMPEEPQLARSRSKSPQLRSQPLPVVTPPAPGVFSLLLL